MMAFKDGRRLILRQVEHGRVASRLTTKRICNTMYDILREIDVDNVSIALVSGRGRQALVEA